MRLSPEGLAFLEHEEGLKTSEYPDSGGNPTIGCGHLLTAVELASGNLSIKGQTVPWRSGITMAQVMDLLGQDCESREDALSRIVVCPLNDNEFAALFSLFFNADPKPDSGLFQTINGGDWTDLRLHWLAYNKVRKDGVLVEDEELKGRRQREWTLWNQPV